MGIHMIYEIKLPDTWLADVIKDASEWYERQDQRTKDMIDDIAALTPGD